MEEVKLLACGLCREGVFHPNLDLFFLFVPKPYKTSAKKETWKNSSPAWRGVCAVETGLAVLSASSDTSFDKNQSSCYL